MRMSEEVLDAYGNLISGSATDTCEPLDSLVDFISMFFRGVKEKTEFVRTSYFCGTVGPIKAVDVARYSNGNLKSPTVFRELSERERVYFREGMLKSEDVRDVSANHDFRGGNDFGFGEMERFVAAERLA